MSRICLNVQPADGAEDAAAANCNVEVLEVVKPKPFEILFLFEIIEAE